MDHNDALKYDSTVRQLVSEIIYIERSEGNQSII